MGFFFNSFFTHFCVLSYSGINLKGCKHFLIELEHISWALRRGGTSFNSHGPFSTALLHISWSFKSSGTNAKKLGLMYTNQFHGTYFNITLIFILTSLGCVKFYGLPKGILFMLHFHYPSPSPPKSTLLAVCAAIKTGAR